ncbi:hypothetical protein Bbelb_058450 [Branchiostoma belcheri]|nr:hypothetical protein Bbelb_058450 [Branchiostoma belcheri]
MSRQRQVIPASRAPPGSPTKDTLHVLESRLQNTEGDTQDLLSQLAEMGFDPRVIMSQQQGSRSHSLDPGVQDPISPFQHRAVAPEVLQKKYEELVARVCRTESTIQSLKLNLVTLQAEKDLRGKDSQGANEQMAAAVEAYDREVKKLKGRQERLQRDMEEAENRRETAVLDVQQLHNALEVANTEKSELTASYEELKNTKQKLSRRLNEIKEELSRESSLRASLEESHATLLARIHSMEGVVETERHEVETLSSDCNVLRKETMQAREELKKEQMIREQVEELVRTLRAETEIREREMKKFVGEHQVNQKIVADLKRQNVELRGESENARRILQEQKEAYHQLEKENQEAHEALKTASGEIAKLMSDHQHALKLEQEKVSTQLKEQDRALQTHKANVSDQVEQQKQEKATIQRENDELKSKISSLERDLQLKEDKSVDQVKKLKLSKQDFLKVLDLQSPLGKSPKKNKEHVLKGSWKDLGESHLEEDYVPPSRESMMESSSDKDDSKIEGLRPSVLEMSDPLFHVLEEDSRRSEEYILGKSDQKDMSDDLEANTISTDLDISGPMGVIDLREKDPVLDSLKTEIKILTREKKRLLKKKGGTTRVSVHGVEKADSSQTVKMQDLVRKSKREETEVVKCEEYVLKKAQLSLHKYKSSYTRALVLKMSSLTGKTMVQTSNLGKECDPVTKSLKEEVKLLRKQRKRLLEQLRRSLLQGFLSSSLKFQTHWTLEDRQFQQGLPMARSQGGIAHKLQQDTSLTMKFRDSVIETLKKEIEQLTKEKEQVLKDKQSLLEEVNQAVDGMTEERQKLQDEMQQYKLEISALSNARQQVEQENMRLLERMGAVEQQQASQKQVEKAMAEMIDSKNRLAYDKGKLQTKVDQLQQELESLANAQSEVVHLRKVNAAVEAKFNKAAAELNACRINMQRTESQLRQGHNVGAHVQTCPGYDSGSNLGLPAQAAIERKEEEFAMAIKARDEAVKEGQRLLDHIEAVEERERQKLEGYKRSLSEAKQDSTRVASTLEGVMQSHTQLQDAVEALQTELGRKDSEIAAMKNERQQFQRNIRQLQGEVEALQSHVAEMEAMESNEVEPLKLALDQTKQDNMKLAASLEGILQSNSQLQSNLDKLQDQLEQKTFQLDKIKTTRSQESEEMKHEVRNYEERLENLKQQFNKERETTRKRHQKELTELRRVHEESFSRVSDLSRTNKQLQGRIDELEQQQARLKDRIRSQKVQLDQLQKERKNHEHTQGKVKTIQAELESLEKVKNEYISKNKEQAKTISSFLEEINSLKSELKALARAQVEASEAVKHQEDELDKERKRTEKYRHKAKKIEGKRKDIEDRLHAANNESMESRFALQEERLKADEQAEKAKQMIRESRKKITRLADYLEADSRDRSRDTSQRDRFDRLGIL